MEKSRQKVRVLVEETVPAYFGWSAGFATLSCPCSTGLKEPEISMPVVAIENGKSGRLYSVRKSLMR